MGKATHVRHGRSTRQAMLSQVFLINKNIARKEAMFAKGKRVIELGTGKGILTEELSKVASSVLSIEIDRELSARASLAKNRPNLKIINADFFDTEISRYDFDIFVSNIPYSLSKEIILWLSKSRMPALLCVQKEFAEKLTAEPGTPKYTSISAISNLSFSVRKVMAVPRQMFRPVPKVDSILIYLEPREDAPSQEILAIVALLMAHRKNLLKKAVYYVAKQHTRNPHSAKAIQSKMNIADARVFDLTLEQISATATKLHVLFLQSSHKE